MNPKRKRRLTQIGLMVAGIGVSAALVLYALSNSINLYFTPSQVDKIKMRHYPQFRMGGMVEKGSIKRSETDLKVAFSITDYHKSMLVHYDGVLPALFREGQGIVVQGHLSADGDFVANTVLAKHDEKYMPPGMPKQSTSKTAQNAVKKKPAESMAQKSTVTHNLRKTNNRAVMHRDVEQQSVVENGMSVNANANANANAKAVIQRDTVSSTLKNAKRGVSAL